LRVNVYEFIGRFITVLAVSIPIFIPITILSFSILPRYLKYMEPKPVEEAAIAAIIAALLYSTLFAIVTIYVSPEQVGQAIIDALRRFIRDIAEYVRRVLMTVGR